MGREFGLAALAALAALVLAASATAQQLPQSTARAPATQPVVFDVYLKLSHSADLDALLEEQQRPGSPDYHRWLTPAAFAARFGAEPAQIARVAAALRAVGLHVEPNGSHALRATGTAATVERALSTHLATGRFADGHTRLVAEAPPVLPAALAEAGAVVAHFMPAEHMRRHSRLVASNLPLNRISTTGLYWFDDLKQAYQFPSYAVANGRGVTIGILMSNDFRPGDMDLYFGNENILPPPITTEPIFGGAPFDPNLSDETSLDIQQAGGMAPLASVILVNPPDLSDASLLAGLTTIVEDNTIDIVNMSFGAPEAEYGPAYNGGVTYTGILTVFDDMFRQGNAQGITFVAAAGDLGSRSLPAMACFLADAKTTCGGYRLSVEMPASSPHVTAVGGTNLVTFHDARNASDLRSTYVSENARPDPLAEDIFFGTPAQHGLWGSGGGISTVFAQPSYQTGVSPLSTDWRIVPDIAFQMGGCPLGAVTPCGAGRSGVVAVLNGAAIGLVGTSAAAPGIAGLLALRVQLTHKRLGNANPSIYALAAAQAAGTGARVFHNDTTGSNGTYRSTQGYNPVLGNGTPIANAFLGVANKAAAGNPQTPSNP